MTDYLGMKYLRNKLHSKEERINLRYQYYEMKNVMHDFNIITPPYFRNFYSSLGWCAKAVDSLSDRLVFDKFDNDSYGMNEIYDMNNKDILLDSAINGALIGACSFIYIAPQSDDHMPKLQAIEAFNATGIIDPTTQMLKEGYAILERDSKNRNNILLEAYFLPFKTYYYPKGKPSYVVNHSSPYPLLVPIIYRPDAKRVFGHSRITRACMDYTQTAMRTIKRSEVASEFYSFPQKYILGLDPEAEPLDKWKASMSSFLQFTKDEDGDSPTVGQFSQQSMQPFLDQLKSTASMFAGETGLTLDDLGFVSSNPSSAEAIKASHDQLRLTARKAQRCFSVGFLNAGYLASCVRDEYPYKRSLVHETKAMWMPLFEPDMNALSLIGDGAIKINQAIPNYFDKKALKQLTGIEPSEED